MLDAAVNPSGSMLDDHGATLGGMPTTSTFAQRLAQAMAQAGMTSTALARRLVSQDGKIGVSRQAVHLALTGQTKSLTAENVARAARACDVDIYWLATGIGSAAPAAAPDSAARPSVTAQQALRTLAAHMESMPKSMRAALAVNMQLWIKTGGDAAGSAAKQSRPRQA